jgi:hypothetical protein
MADCASEDSRAKMVESTMLPQVIAMMKDSDADVRSTATNAIIKLAIYGMNFS